MWRFCVLHDCKVVVLLLLLLLLLKSVATVVLVYLHITACIVCMEANAWCVFAGDQTGPSCFAEDACM